MRRWEQLSCTANSVYQPTKTEALFIRFIFNGMGQEFSHSENINFQTSDQYTSDKREINSYLWNCEMERFWFPKIVSLMFVSE